MPKFRIIIIFISIILLLGILYAPAQVFGASLSQQQAQLEKQKVDAAKKKADAAKQEEQRKKDAERLKTEITRVEGDITNTQNALAKTKQNLKSTQGSIIDTQSKIEVKRKELEQTKVNLSQMMVADYTTQNNQFLKTFASSQSISDVFEQLRSEEAFENQFQAIVDKATVEKTDLEAAKKDLEKKMADLQGLKKQQEVQESGLQMQQNQKNKLLSDTNDEIKNLQAEQDQMNRIEADLQHKIEEVIQEQIRQAKNSANYANGPGAGTPVARGSVIGYIGSTGYSTGPHLHLELRSAEGTAINPLFLIDNEVPISGEHRISQYFGMSDYARGGAYGGGPHTGVDLAAPAGTPIRAVKTGVIIFRQYYGGYGNAVLISHPDGTYTLYGHMISL